MQSRSKEQTAGQIYEELSKTLSDIFRCFPRVTNIVRTFLRTFAGLVINDHTARVPVLVLVVTREDIEVSDVHHFRGEK